jgi:putative phosphoribosyl transferase
MTLFANRTSAGQALATRLPEYANRDVLVLGLPRGGVPVAYEVAKALNAELDVMIVRKVGAPFQPELALGAVASGGVVVLNEDLIAFGENEAAVRQHAQEKLREVATRERRFRGDRPPPEIANRTVILVDDGAATGASMIAAVRATRALGARRIVVALPVAPADTCAKLAQDADEVACLAMPEIFRAVGDWYADFSQTEDAEVIELLEKARHRTA